MHYEDDYSFARPLMGADEYVLWKGRPAEGNLLTAQDLLMIPFSVLWCGFALFWEISAIKSGAPFPFALFGIPFVCVGIYITVGRFFHTAWLRKRTFYVITNKKIIRRRGNRTDFLDGATLPPSHTEVHRNGNATIRFGYGDPYHRNSRSAVGSGFCLENIPEIARVQQAISQMEK